MFCEELPSQMMFADQRKICLPPSFESPIANIITARIRPGKNKLILRKKSESMEEGVLKLHEF